jgi:hypothetical protein
VGGPGLAFESWVFRFGPHDEVEPRSPKEQVCFTCEVEGRELSAPPFAKNAKDGGGYRGKNRGFSRGIRMGHPSTSGGDRVQRALNGPCDCFLNCYGRAAILSQRSFMISHRHWRIWTAIAVLSLIVALVMLSPVGLACFVLLPFSFIGLIPIPVLLLRRDLLRADHIPDAPCLPASFQRPPPFRLA